MEVNVLCSSLLAVNVGRLFIALGIIAVVVIVIFIRVHRSSSCPSCKKRNTMREYKRKEIRRSKRSEDLGNGKKRYYSLVTYEITYKCESCGAEKVRRIEVEED